MLVALAIRDIVLIDRLDIEFADGLTMLTGETGAGKSILLDAFALALGARGDGSLVRAGQPQGQVTAIFDAPTAHVARKIANEQAIDVEGDLVLRRVQMADGRTRAFVNDQPVSAQALRAIARTLVEIHGQHDDRALVDPASHRDLLDAHGGLQAQAMAVRAAHRAMRDAASALAEEEARLAAARAQADYLRHAHEELATLAPQDGEETALAARRQDMMAAEKVAGELSEAQDVVGGDHSPVPAIAGALRRLERRGAGAEALLGPAIKAIGDALDALETARTALDEALRAADFDPLELERIEERLFALRAASRKHQVPVEGLVALQERFAADLAALGETETRVAALRAEAAACRADYESKATALSDARRAAAKKIDTAVMKELAPLKLERARFTTRVDSDPQTGGPDGFDRVEFWVETNPGTRPGPLMKVASGGELARFMLALKVVLADRGSAPTLVFDEIDTGVGGAVADAIGQRLARLAGRVQVLAVTHAPQVAARADRHFRIAKDLRDRGKRVSTDVAVLDAASRREEIARMLSGAQVTDEARAAAGRLLEKT